MLDPHLTTERRINRAEPSRAEDRALLLELASKHAAKSRVHGVGEEVRKAWADFVAAVDRVVGDAQ